MNDYMQSNSAVPIENSLNDEKPTGYFESKTNKSVESYERFFKSTLINENRKGIKRLLKGAFERSHRFGPEYNMKPEEFVEQYKLEYPDAVPLDILKMADSATTLEAKRFYMEASDIMGDPLFRKEILKAREEVCLLYLRLSSE